MIKIAASPKDLIDRFGVQDSPMLQFYIHSLGEPYLPTMDEVREAKQSGRPIWGKGELQMWIGNNVLPKVYNLMNPNAENNYYFKDKNSINVEAFVAAHEQDEDSAYIIEKIQKGDEEGARDLILQRINEAKGEAFSKWARNMEESNIDPAFKVLLLNAVFASSPANRITPVAVPFEAEIVDVLRKEVEETFQEGGNKQPFNVYKTYRQLVGTQNKIDAAEDSHLIQYINDNKYWRIIPSKIKSQQNPRAYGSFESNLTDLMNYGSRGGWCVGQQSYANDYLSTGDFHILFDNEKPVVAIRFEGDDVAEVRGINNISEEIKPYWEETFNHIHPNPSWESGAQQTEEYGIVEDIYIKNKSFDDPQLKAELLSNLSNPETYREYSQSISEENLRRPEVIAALKKAFLIDITSQVQRNIFRELEDEIDEETGVGVGEGETYYDYYDYERNDYDDSPNYTRERFFRDYILDYMPSVLADDEETNKIIMQEMKRYKSTQSKKLRLPTQFLEKNNYDKMPSVFKDPKIIQNTIEDTVKTYGFKYSIPIWHKEVIQLVKTDKNVMDKVMDEMASSWCQNARSGNGRDVYGLVSDQDMQRLRSSFLGSPRSIKRILEKSIKSCPTEIAKNYSNIHTYLKSIIENHPQLQQYIAENFNNKLEEMKQKSETEYYSIGTDGEGLLEFFNEKNIAKILPILSKKEQLYKILDTFLYMLKNSNIHSSSRILYEFYATSPKEIQKVIEDTSSFRQTVIGIVKNLYSDGAGLYSLFPNDSYQQTFNGIKYSWEVLPPWLRSQELIKEGLLKYVKDNIEEKPIDVASLILKHYLPDEFKDLLYKDAQLRLYLFNALKKYVIKIDQGEKGNDNNVASVFLTKGFNLLPDEMKQLSIQEILPRAIEYYLTKGKWFEFLRDYLAKPINQQLTDINSDVFKNIYKPLLMKNLQKTNTIDKKPKFDNSHLGSQFDKSLFRPEVFKDKNIMGVFNSDPDLQEALMNHIKNPENMEANYHQYITLLLNMQSSSDIATVLPKLNKTFLEILPQIAFSAASDPDHYYSNSHLETLVTSIHFVPEMRSMEKMFVDNLINGMMSYLNANNSSYNQTNRLNYICKILGSIGAKDYMKNVIQNNPTYNNIVTNSVLKKIYEQTAKRNDDDQKEEPWRVWDNAFRYGFDFIDGDIFKMVLPQISPDITKLMIERISDNFELYSAFVIATLSRLHIAKPILLSDGFKNLHDKFFTSFVKKYTQNAIQLFDLLPELFQRYDPQQMKELILEGWQKQKEQGDIQEEQLEQHRNKNQEIIEKTYLKNIADTESKGERIYTVPNYILNTFPRIREAYINSILNYNPITPYAVRFIQMSIENVLKSAVANDPRVKIKIEQLQQLQQQLQREKNASNWYRKVRKCSEYYLN